MSNPTLPESPAPVKPETAHPLLGMLRALERSCQTQDWLAAARLRDLVAQLASGRRQA